MGCHFLLQGLLPTQRLSPCLVHWQPDSLPLQGTWVPSLVWELRSHTPWAQEQKVYVQHRLRALGPLVWELLDGRGAHFYLAG